MLTWSKKNFGDQDPVNCLFGIAEELGELCHAHLKDKQGIRLNKNEVEFKRKDAIADTVIYLLDFTARLGIVIDDFTEVNSGNLPPDEYLTLIIYECGNLANSFIDHSLTEIEVYAKEILRYLDAYANCYNLNLMVLVPHIWEGTVSKRTWQRSR